MSLIMNQCNNQVFYFFSFQPGLQEYVEAVSFQYFIKTRTLVSIEEINKQLIFAAEDKEEETKVVRIFVDVLMVCSVITIVVLT